VRSIGADEVIDYTREDIVNGTRRYDLIFDTRATARSPFCGRP
jgi:NADPH:quinone reductase-like Zn-dependent oxidoreductase